MPKSTIPIPVIEILEERSPVVTEVFGSIRINNTHVWRFDTMQQARDFVERLQTALQIPIVGVPVITLDDVRKRWRGRTKKVC